MPGVIVPRESDRVRTNWQSYAIRVGCERQGRIMQQLLDEQISTRRGALNAHREQAYPEGTWRAAGSLARSEEAEASAIVLPLFHQLTHEDQDRVIDAVRRATAVR
jgi:dTDP-4-amino-4,6-dideoxygalactose transaminase